MTSSQEECIANVCVKVNIKSCNGPEGDIKVIEWEARSGLYK